MQKLLFALLLSLVLLGTSAQAQTKERCEDPGPDELVAGFIYVGPTGDAGWTYAHDIGRQVAELRLPWLCTTFIESVPEADVEPFIDQMVADGAQVIFATSFGYGEGVLAAAEQYPDVIFGHATGYQRAPNVANYHGDFYEVYYLNGMMAGALTKTNKLGYIGAFPIPEVKRHINAYAMGAKAVNPEVEVEVTWIFEWFNPAGAKEATEALMAEGADVFAFSEDTPTVIQTAAEKDALSFGHYSPMMQFAPDHVVSGQLSRWDHIYIDFLSKVKHGIYTPENLEDVDIFEVLKDGSVDAAADPGVFINPLFNDALAAYEMDGTNALDLITQRYEEMKAGEFEPFTGPLNNRKGGEILADGEVISYGELVSMEWVVDNIVGDWPNEPE